MKPRAANVYFLLPSLCFPFFSEITRSCNAFINLVSASISVTAFLTQYHHKNPLAHEIQPFLWFEELRNRTTGPDFRLFQAESIQYGGRNVHPSDPYSLRVFTPAGQLDARTNSSTRGPDRDSNRLIIRRLVVVVLPAMIGGNEYLMNQCLLSRSNIQAYHCVVGVCTVLQCFEKFANFSIYSLTVT